MKFKGCSLYSNNYNAYSHSGPFKKNLFNFNFFNKKALTIALLVTRPYKHGRIFLVPTDATVQGTTRPCITGHHDN